MTIAAKKEAEGGPTPKSRKRSEKPHRPPNKAPRPRMRWSMAAWLEAFRETASVTLACERVGIGVTTAYDRRRYDPEFAKRWDETDFSVDVSHKDSIRKRAFDGHDVPVIKAVDTIEWVDDKGRKHKTVVYKQVGTEKRYETGLTIWMAENRWADEFMRQIQLQRAIEQGENPREFAEQLKEAHARMIASVPLSESNGNGHANGNRQVHDAPALPAPDDDLG